MRKIIKLAGQGILVNSRTVDKAPMYGLNRGSEQFKAVNKLAMAVATKRIEPCVGQEYGLRRKKLNR